GVTKTTYYTYNLDGSVASVKYPSGNTIAYTAGNASRSTAAVDQTNSINYVTGAHYSPFGALAAVTNGTGISSTFVYNNRLQPCWIYATTATALPWSTTNCSGTAAAATLLDLKFNLNSGTANNGNVVSATNNRDNTRSQNFTYDTLNLLASAITESAGHTHNSNCSQYIFFGGAQVARRDYQGNVVYYSTDHLGSSRVAASSAGVILDDSDFYPFGGERAVLSSSGNSYKFTGQERDSESGLDYASARHYSSALGRFTSPDPLGGSPENPQSWNRYSYVMNNPLN